jgi:uncharacterized protein with PIN domain
MRCPPPFAGAKGFSALRSITPPGDEAISAQRLRGDCFAYAMAKNAQVTVLFKGEDFDKTDILHALR